MPVPAVDRSQESRPVYVLDTIDWSQASAGGTRSTINDFLSDELDEFTSFSPQASHTGDTNDDNYIDPAFGHHHFIEFIIRTIAPTAKVTQLPVLTNHGATTDAAVARTLAHLHQSDSSVGIVNLSLGAYTENDDPPVATTAVIEVMLDAGWTFVASAGNDASCRPLWPAAHPDVVGVGAVGPHGVAAFSNFGDWVNASAPGVDLIGPIPDPLQALPTGREDNELMLNDEVEALGGERMVMWSGTSFSTPAVLAALVRQSELEPGGDFPTRLAGAMNTLLNDPKLLRLPKLGTVINAVNVV